MNSIQVFRKFSSTFFNPSPKDSSNLFDETIIEIYHHAKSWNKKIFKQIDEQVNKASKDLAEFHSGCRDVLCRVTET